jgi:hypothetical protein
MSGFLRKASLKVKGSAHNLADIADGKDTKGARSSGNAEAHISGSADHGGSVGLSGSPASSKPPKSRSASAATSIRTEEAGAGVNNGDASASSPKRKPSLACVCARRGVWATLDAPRPLGVPKSH